MTTCSCYHAAHGLPYRIVIGPLCGLALYFPLLAVLQGYLLLTLQGAPQLLSGSTFSLASAQAEATLSNAA